MTKHAILLVALIESATTIASAVLQDMGITSTKDQSKMIDQIRSKEREETPLGPAADNLNHYVKGSIEKMLIIMQFLLLDVMERQ